jgi:predicted Fe-Mo cluster-binding NifX family protein
VKDRCPSWQATDIVSVNGGRPGEAVVLREDIEPMRVAVASMGHALEEPVSPSVGECHFWLVVDPSTMEHEAIQNPFASLSGPGAAKFLADQLKAYGVGAVLVGAVGCKELEQLRRAGIRVLLGMAGSGRDVVEKFKRSTQAFT